MHELYDAAVGTSDAAREAQSRCVEICGGCPALSDCRRWAHGLPEADRKALGVVAGLVPAMPVKPQSKTKPQSAIATGSKPQRRTRIAAPHNGERRRDIERLCAVRCADRAARLATALRSVS